jgi:hypothetical protein
LFWQQSSRWSMQHARVVSKASFVLAVLGCAIAAIGLKFQVNADPHFTTLAAYERHQQAYDNAFGQRQEIMITVRGQESAAITAAVADLELALNESRPQFKQVLAFTDLTPWRALAVHNLTPEKLQQCEWLVQQRLALPQQMQQLEQHLTGLQHSTKYPSNVPIPAGGEPRWLLSELNAWLLENAKNADAEENASPAAESQLLQEIYANLEQYSRAPLFSADHREAYVYVELNSPNPAADATRLAWQQLTRTVSQQSDVHPQVQYQLTGELAHALPQHQARFMTLLKCAGLLVLGSGLCVGLGFVNGRQISVVLGCLFLVVGWWLGMITLTVGYLNSVTALAALVFLPVLLGSLVLLLARWNEYRQRGVPCDDALASSLTELGPTLSLSACLLNVALVSLRGSGYVPLIELGMVSAGGVLLGILAVAIPFPALLALATFHLPTANQSQVLDLGIWRSTPQRWPLFTLFTFALGVCALTAGMNRLQLNFLQPPAAAPFAYVLCNTAEQRETLRQQLLATESIATVDEWVPPPVETDPLKRRSIVKIGTLLEQLSASSSPALSVRLSKLGSQATNLLSDWREPPLPPELIGRLQQTFRRWERAVAQQQAENLNAEWVSLLPFLSPEAPRLSDLSPALVARSQGRNGEWLLRVTPREDFTSRAAWHRFVLDVERIAPTACGPAITHWHSGRRLQTAFFHAAVYTLLLVAMVQLFAQQSIAGMGLALAPMLSALIFVLGCAGWCDVAFTPLTCLALPGILAMGAWMGGCATSTVPRTNAVPLCLSLCSALILLSALPWLLAPHNELRDFGRLLTFGTLGSCAAALFLIPAFNRESQQWESTLPAPHFTMFEMAVPQINAAENSVAAEAAELRETNATLLRPHRRLIQPTRTKKVSVPPERAA